jgi:hypothetical protein
MKYLFFILLFSFTSLQAQELSAEEKQTLSVGEVTSQEHVVGGILGIYPGFGLGHVVQDRWSEKGYIFTAGQLGSLAVLTLGVGSCLGSTIQNSPNNQKESCNNALVVVGAISFLGFKIWEIVDIWAGPAIQNRKYRKVKEKMAEMELTSWEFSPMLNPLEKSGGLVLSYSF